MSFKVYEPGERSKKDWVARTIVNGDRREHVLHGCKNKAEANLRAAQIELERIAQAKPGTNEQITFRDAAYMYAKHRGIDLDCEPRLLSEYPRAEQQRIIKLIKSDLGVKLVREITLDDIVDTAKTMLPGRAPQTQNRYVMAPAASILHHVSKHGNHCSWLRVELFPEDEPKTRSVTQAVEDKLLQAKVTPMQHLMLAWLFYHGRRVSETLRITWKDIDLDAVPRPTYTFINTKHKNKEKVMPFHSEVLRLLLAAVPEDQRHGKLWTWSNRGSVNYWLQPLTQRLGVEFTCHMARHTLGKKLNARGNGLKTIMDTLGHASARSSLRYQSTDINDVAAALEDAQAYAKPQQQLRKAS